MITKLNDIAEAVGQSGARRLVVVCAADASTLKAVSEAVDRRIVAATLLGEASAIEGICIESGIDSAKFRIIDQADEESALETGVRMVHDGQADILMKGLLPTDRYVRAILNKEYGLMPPRKGLLSHITVFEAPFYHKLLIISDPAVIIAPDLSQKIEIARNITGMARFLGNREPKIACIAASEQVLPSSQASVEAAILTEMSKRGQLGDAVVEGPLSVDIALFSDVAETKRLKGDRIAGDVDGLLFPNIESANVFYKLLTHLGGAKAAPLLAGTTSPCILTSRADDTLTKFNAIALAAISVSK
jgi:phosphate butyryltransferase